MLFVFMCNSIRIYLTHPDAARIQVSAGTHTRRNARGKSLPRAFWIQFLLRRRVPLFACFHAVVDPHFIRNRAAAGANCASDQRAFTASGKSSDNGPANGRASDNLGAGVMPVVMPPLRFHGPAMSVIVLRKSCERCGKHSCKSDAAEDLIYRHIIPLSSNQKLDADITAITKTKSEGDIGCLPRRVAWCVDFLKYPGQKSNVQPAHS
jgi:hypothetical protein